MPGEVLEVIMQPQQQQQQHASKLLPTVLRALGSYPEGDAVSAFFRKVTAAASTTQLQQLVLALLHCMEDGSSSIGIDSGAADNSCCAMVLT
jgi:hypothetical protein